MPDLESEPPLPVVAPFWRRGLASLFDALLMTLLAILLVAPFLPLQEKYEKFIKDPSYENRKEFLPVRNTVRNYALIFWFVYASAFEASALQGTLGKRLLGLRVVNFAGGRITYPQSLKRAVGKFFSLLPCGAGFIWAAFTKKHLTWHDAAAGTVVIRSANRV